MNYSRYNTMCLKNIYFILIIVINIINIIQYIKCDNKIKENNSVQTFNDFLFDSIKSDNFNLTNIFNKNYRTIKIKKYSSNKKNILICVFGILVNKLGLKIEKEMTNWLEKEYIIYKVYQKYPGILFEYPALKFAQYLVEKKNISFILYLHTKGASYYKKISLRPRLIRNLWKKEFSRPRNQLYISQLIKNEADITIPLRTGIATWYNGMFISKRAFQLNNILLYRNRFVYEVYFKNNHTRIKGIVSNNCKNLAYYLSLYDDKSKSIFLKNIVFNYISRIINYIYKSEFLYHILYLLIFSIIKVFRRYYYILNK